MEGLLKESIDLVDDEVVAPEDGEINVREHDEPADELIIEEVNLTPALLQDC